MDTMINRDFVGPTVTVTPQGELSDKTPLELSGAQLHGIYVLLRQERRRNPMIPQDDVELDHCITVIFGALMRSGFLERRDQQIRENLKHYLGSRYDDD